MSQVNYDQYADDTQLSISTIDNQVRLWMHCLGVWKLGGQMGNCRLLSQPLTRLSDIEFEGP